MDIPIEVLETFRQFRTAEMTTISRRGEPITWPVATSFDLDVGRFLITTSIGLPAKAFNLRRNSRASLFFSEPAASGLESPPAVIVQGLADVEDRVASIDGLEEYWKTIWKRQPASKLYSLPIVRLMSDYYYMRIIMTIAPTRLVWWPNADFDLEPNELRLEARS
jgi:hypothetical protein